MFMNTEGDAIRSIISGFESTDGVNSRGWHLFCFAATWYFWTIVTYGVWVPAGLFLPGILIGCSVGVLYMDILINIFGLNINAIGGQSYIILGASAMLAGYCRLTYSLAVIMLETT